MRDFVSKKNQAKQNSTYYVSSLTGHSLLRLFAWYTWAQKSIPSTTTEVGEDNFIFSVKMKK